MTSQYIAVQPHTTEWDKNIADRFLSRGVAGCTKRGRRTRIAIIHGSTPSPVVSRLNTTRNCRGGDSHGMRRTETAAAKADIDDHRLSGRRENRTATINDCGQRRRVRLTATIAPNDNDSCQRQGLRPSATTCNQQQRRRTTATTCSQRQRPAAKETQPASPDGCRCMDRKRSDCGQRQGLPRTTLCSAYPRHRTRYVRNRL